MFIPALQPHVVDAHSAHGTNCGFRKDQNILWLVGLRDSSEVHLDYSSSSQEAFPWLPMMRSWSCFLSASFFFSAIISACTESPQISIVWSNSTWYVEVKSILNLVTIDWSSQCRTRDPLHFRLVNEVISMVSPGLSCSLSAVAQAPQSGSKLSC